MDATLGKLSVKDSLRSRDGWRKRENMRDWVRVSTKERTEERVRTKTERYNRTMRNRY